MTSPESQPLLPFAFCVSCLENTRCWHQIFYILSKNLVFWFQFQVFFLNSIYSCWEICEGDMVRKVLDTTAYHREYLLCAYIKPFTLLMRETLPEVTTLYSSVLPTSFIWSPFFQHCFVVQYFDKLIAQNCCWSLSFPWIFELSYCKLNYSGTNCGPSSA